MIIKVAHVQDKAGTGPQAEVQHIGKAQEQKPLATLRSWKTSGKLYACGKMPEEGAVGP